MSKYPLICKEKTITYCMTLEDKEIEKRTCFRRVKPARELITKEDIDSYINQMGAARMHYNNIMDLPYCTEYAVQINHPLYDYAVTKQDALPSKNDKIPLKKNGVDADLIIQGELGELDDY